MKHFERRLLLAAVAALSLMGGLVTNAQAQSNPDSSSCIVTPYGWNIDAGSFGPAQYNACVSDREMVESS